MVGAPWGFGEEGKEGKLHLEAKKMAKEIYKAVKIHESDYAVLAQTSEETGIPITRLIHIAVTRALKGFDAVVSRMSEIRWGDGGNY